MGKHEEVVVQSLPKCDFCDDRAVYDGKTSMGPWAYMCEMDFNAYGIGVGLGKGQRLIPADNPPVDGKSVPIPGTVKPS